MIREKSVGAVVYVPAEGGRKYLVEHMAGGHFSLCKGHVEAGETEVETARREIREETGLTVDIDTGFRAEIEYSPYEGCRKTVIFFAAQAGGTETTAQPEEVREILWLGLEEALSILTYEDDKNVLRKAEKYLG